MENQNFLKLVLQILSHQIKFGVSELSKISTNKKSKKRLEKLKNSLENVRAEITETLENVDEFPENFQVPPDNYRAENIIPKVYRAEKVNSNYAGKFKNGNVRAEISNWEEYLESNPNESEMIFLSVADLEDIRERFGMGLRCAYDYRMRSRVELGIIPTNKYYPRRKWRRKIK